MRESAIERYLVQRVRTLGGLCIKITSPGLIGMPDRLVLLPRGWVIWVELKARYGKVSPAQRRRHQELQEMQQTVLVLNSIELIDEHFTVV